MCSAPNGGRARIKHSTVRHLMFVVVVSQILFLSSVIATAEDRILFLRHLVTFPLSPTNYRTGTFAAARRQCTRTKHRVYATDPINVLEIEILNTYSVSSVGVTRGKTTIDPFPAFALFRVLCTETI